MTDDELMTALETGTLEPSLFTHEAPVRAAWHCLRQAPFPEALVRFSRALRQFATQQGEPSKYHETITVAYAALIAERLHETPALDWGHSRRNILTCSSGSRRSSRATTRRRRSRPSVRD